MVVGVNLVERVWWHMARSSGGGTGDESRIRSTGHVRYASRPAATRRCATATRRRHDAQTTFSVVRRDGWAGPPCGSFSRHRYRATLEVAPAPYPWLT